MSQNNHDKQNETLRKLAEMLEKEEAFRQREVVKNNEVFDKLVKKISGNSEADMVQRAHAAADRLVDSINAWASAVWNENNQG